MKAVIDTNILVDHLGGVEAARSELTRYREPAISLVTWMEILVGARTEEEEGVLRAFLTRFERLPVSATVAERAIALRRKHHVKLPDAIIWATAQTENSLLVSRNTRDFPADDPGVRVPY